MPKYKKCPRCDVNYIPEEKEYCDICEAEMRGVTFEEIIDDEEAELCPKCHINYLGEGETICEACAALISEEDKDEAGWEKEEEVLEEGLDEDDILLADEESLVEDEAWEEETEGEDDIIIDDELGDEDLDDFADVADEEDEEDFEDEEEDSEDDE